MFKDDYKKLNEDITPDLEFISDLAKKMKAVEMEQQPDNNEQPKIQEPKAKVIPIWTRYVAVAACLLIVVGVVGIVGITRNGNDKVDSSESNVGNLADGSNLDDSVIGDFDCNTVADYNTFLDMLDTKLVDIYENSKNTFVTENMMDVAERDELVENIMAATECEKSSENSPVYYMAVFEDNTVVKFTIYDNRYMVIQGIDGIYSIR